MLGLKARSAPQLLPTEHALRQVSGNMRAASLTDRPSGSLFILVKCFTQIIISKINIVKIQIICSRNERITVRAHQSGGSAPKARGFLRGYWEPRWLCPQSWFEMARADLQNRLQTERFFHPQLWCPNEIWELIKNLTNCRGKKQ